MDFVRILRTCRVAAIAFSLVVATFHEVHADALVVTRAMQASTIVEVFVDESQIRVEFEIGAVDVAAFANVLPDELFEKVTGDSKPFDERLQTFFASDWVVRGDGQPLRGKVEQVMPAKRVVRDDVTGEALAKQPADAENVIRLTVLYELQKRPQSLTIHPPRTGDDVVANIGFVCYHDGLPINDFRYMPGKVTLDLDWADPWYSRFRHANLRRQFDAPLSAYLYVEPFEVRKEVIVRPKDLQQWVDLKLPDDGVIPIGQQDELKKRVAEFLSAENPVFVDGRRAQGRLDRIHFIHRTLRTTGIIEPPVDLDVTSATMGVIFVYPTDSLPKQVTMQWELFTPRIQNVPAVASDEAGGLPSEITPESPVLEWKNYLTNPTSPELRAVENTTSQQQIQIPLLSLLCGCVAIASAGVFFKRKSSGNRSSKPALLALMCAVLAGVVAFPAARVSVPSPLSSAPLLSESEGRELVATLLYNVYRSFDHHDESLIYDRLSQSITGDLLSEVYLETRKSMEVKNQGGLRVSVKEVDVMNLDSVDTAATGSTFKCRWRVAGWIGHWGHIHRRENEHVALITVAPREHRWKITAMEILDEQSFEPSSRPIMEEETGA